MLLLQDVVKAYELFDQKCTTTLFLEDGHVVFSKRNDICTTTL